MSARTYSILHIPPQGECSLDGVGGGLLELPSEDTRKGSNEVRSHLAFNLCLHSALSFGLRDKQG